MTELASEVIPEAKPDAVTPEEASPYLSPDPPEEKILDPKLCRFFRTDEGIARLEIEGDRTVLTIGISRLFPVTFRRNLLSVTDGSNDEVGILRSLRALKPPMRRIVLEELRKRYMVPQITSLNRLKSEFGVFYWTVDTTRGPRDFVVRDVRDNIREFANGRLLITDVDGNQFEIMNIETLPGKAANELYRVL